MSRRDILRTGAPLLLAPLLTACGSAAAAQTLGAAPVSTAASATSVSASGAASRAVVSEAGMATGSASGPAETATGAAASVRLAGALTVFAASSLTATFKEIGAALQQANPGASIAFNFAGSPTLRAQLSQGARADVFASADEQNMAGAQRDGSIGGTPAVFARNRLVVIVPAANPAAIASPRDLAKPGVKLDLAAPAVPVGNYAREAFAKMARNPSFGSGFAAAVAKNVVSNESDVKQVLAKVQLGEVDAGVVYETDVTPSVRAAVKEIAIPDQFNVIAEYPIAVVSGAPNPAGARAFIAYVLSPAGQAVLARYGFAPSTGPLAAAGSG